MVGIALQGGATALAELTVSAPGWDGAGISRVTLHGADARVQLLVTGTDAAGRITDQTRDAVLTAKPSGLVRITDGLAEPLANGKGVITATIQAGGTATIPFEVKAVTAERPVNFANSVVPLFTKHGCNSGGCHGKSSGQNGFKLSLLGFEPQEDYEYLLREARGRRIFPAAPERSLLLLKATGQLPHGGGSRIDAGSFDYRMLVKWIRQGMPYGKPNDPKLESITLHPAERIMKPSARQQLVVLARMSDGSIEDITHSAVYEANDREYADADNTGLVTVGSRPGEIAVMVRYQDKATVFRASIPLGVPVDKLPEEKNFVDKFIFAKLKTVGMPPSELAPDSTYLRRVTL
ncbi:MAG: Ig-like domain-containing protein, partial [Verrucomicrobiia bacterium]